jgi:hypothetical protein
MRNSSCNTNTLAPCGEEGSIGGWGSVMFASLEFYLLLHHQQGLMSIGEWIMPLV